MRSPFRWRQRSSAASDERGMTLVELTASMAILGIVLAAAYGVMASVQKGYERQVDRTVNVVQIGQAMQQLQKEIFSAEAIDICSNATCTSLVTNGTECTTPTDQCYLLVYTQTNANSRELASPGPASPFTCVEWKVAQVAGSPTKYALLSRRWQSDYINNPGALVGGWRWVTDPMPILTASFVIPTSSNNAASFDVPADASCDGCGAFGGRLLQVRLTMNNQPLTRVGTSNISVMRQLTGANIVSSSYNPCIPPTGVIPPG